MLDRRDDPPRLDAPRALTLELELESRRLCRPRPTRDEKRLALDDGLGDLDELAGVVARVRPQQVERAIAVDAVDGHEDALRLLDDGASREGVLETVVLAVALERDLDCRLQIVRVATEDVAECACARGLADVCGIRAVEQNE